MGLNTEDVDAEDNDVVLLVTEEPFLVRLLIFPPMMPLETDVWQDDDCFDWDEVELVVVVDPESE